ncbi:MAG: stalk domain-containing protein [Clostridiales bacterium]|nr:stalk domain-containing protein [Clostridiales bacterium]
MLSIKMHFPSAKWVCMVAILALAAALPPQALAEAKSASVYQHAYECIQLLESGRYTSEPSGGSSTFGNASGAVASGGGRVYVYQTTDELFLPKNDDYPTYYSKINKLIHFVFTGSPAHFEARFSAGVGYGENTLVFDMLVHSSANRTQEARGLAKAAVTQALTNEMSIREKYYALYEWVTYHIRYDSRALDAGTQEGRVAYTEGQSYENALLQGQAVCGGIGRAYMLLCQIADLPVLLVTGDESADHAWNKVYLDGKWLNVDVTDACRAQNVFAGAFAVEDSALTGSRYKPQLEDYMEIVPYLYPDLSRWDRLPEPEGGALPGQAPDTEQELARIPDANETKVFIDGDPIVFDVPPQIVNDRILVPLRAIFQAMGAQVDWDGDAQSVTAVKGDRIVILTIGDASPTINGTSTPIDQSAIIVESRTLAPLRFVAEAFGGSVQWVGEENAAYITR